MVLEGTERATSIDEARARKNRTKRKNNLLSKSSSLVEKQYRS
jgi:hypothetical protein